MIKQAKPYVVQGEGMDQKAQDLYLSVLIFTGLDMRPLEPVLQRFVDRCEARWPVSCKRLRLQAESDVSQTLQRRGHVYRTVIDLERQAAGAGVAHA